MTHFRDVRASLCNHLECMRTCFSTVYAASLSEREVPELGQQYAMELYTMSALTTTRGILGREFFSTSENDVLDKWELLATIVFNFVDWDTMSNGHADLPVSICFVMRPLSHTPSNSHTHFPI